MWQTITRKIEKTTNTIYSKLSFCNTNLYTIWEEEKMFCFPSLHQSFLFFFFVSLQESDGATRENLYTFSHTWHTMCIYMLYICWIVKSAKMAVWHLLSVDCWCSVYAAYYTLDTHTYTPCMRACPTREDSRRQSTVREQHSANWSFTHTLTLCRSLSFSLSVILLCSTNRSGLPDFHIEITSYGNGMVAVVGRCFTAGARLFRTCLTELDFVCYAAMLVIHAVLYACNIGFSWIVGSHLNYDIRSFE